MRKRGDWGVGWNGLQKIYVPYRTYQCYGRRSIERQQRLPALLPLSEHITSKSHDSPRPSREQSQNPRPRIAAPCAPRSGMASARHAAWGPDPRLERNRNSMPREGRAWIHLLATGCASLALMGTRRALRKILSVFQPAGQPGLPAGRASVSFIQQPSMHSRNGPAFQHRPRWFQPSSPFLRRMPKCPCPASAGARSARGDRAGQRGQRDA